MTTTANKEIVRQANLAFATGDMEAFLQYCSEDVRWTMVGMPAWEGKAAILESMLYDEYTGSPVFTIQNMIAEDDKVVCNGNVSMTKKTGEIINGSYCDIYRLENGIIMELNSYMVEFKQA